MTMKGLVPLLGVNLNARGEKAKRVLGWSPRSPEEAILASAESLVRLGLMASRITNTGENALIPQGAWK